MGFIKLGRNFKDSFLRSLAWKPAIATPASSNLHAPGQFIYSNKIETSAANLLVAHGKVLEILRGKIPLPEVVELFITNFCDFSCPHCRCAPYRGGNDQYFNFGTMGALFDELREKGIKTLEFGGGGEPLMHPQVNDIFRRLNEQAFRVGLITNGYRFTQEPGLMDLVIGCSDWVRFSLDAVSNDTFRKVHGKSNLNYDALREAIIAMVNKTRQKSPADHRPRIGLKMIIQQFNKHEVLRSIDEALAMGVDNMQFKFLEGHPLALNSDRERSDIIDGLKLKIQEIKDTGLVVEILAGYGGERQELKKCRMAVLHPLVDWDGEIYMCAFFHHRKERHSIGNINDGGFFVHWGTEEHKRKIAETNPKECVINCPMLRYDPVIEYIEKESARFHYI